MNQKYTPATAVAIKRDVQRSQDKLAFILGEIERKLAEKVVLDAVLDEKRGLVGRFEDMIMTVFQRENTKVANLHSRKDSLEDVIGKLETAKDLLNTQILLQKQKAKEPKVAILVDSMIKNLSGTLDAMLSKIDVTEAQLKKLEKDKLAFTEKSKELKNGIIAQEALVAVENQKMKDIEKNRAAQLKELAREKINLTSMKARERDISVMSRRLTAEYRAVYDAAPKRNPK